MSKHSEPATLTDLLREALAAAESLRGVQRDTGLKRQALAKFLRGEQSLRLDKADILAKHFNIVSRREQ